MTTVRKFLSNSLLLAVLLISSIAQPMEKSGPREIAGDQTLAKSQNTPEHIDMIPEGFKDQTVVLRSNDEPLSSIKIPLVWAEQSVAIKGMLEDLVGTGIVDQSIPVHNVSFHILKHVVNCLKIMHQEKANDAIAMKKVADYVKKHVTTSQELYDLFIAANYMDIKIFFDVCAQAWGELYLSNQSSEVRQEIESLNDSLPAELNRFGVQFGKHHLEITTWLRGLIAPQMYRVLFDRLKSVRLSQDGNTLVLGGFYQNAYESWYGSVQVWKKNEDGTWKSLETVDDVHTDVDDDRADVNDDGTDMDDGHADVVNSVCSSEDGRIIVSGSDDHTVKVWEENTHGEFKCNATLDEHTDCVNLVCISGDGETIVSGSSDNTIKIWEKDDYYDTWKCVTTLDATNDGHTDMVNLICLSQNGKMLVSGSADYTVKVWKEVYDTWVCVATLDNTNGGHTHSVSSVFLSRDGRTLVSGSRDETIKVWKEVVGQWECAATLDNTNGAAHLVCFSQDGKSIVSACDDLTVKIWKQADDKWVCVATLDDTESGHFNRINSVCLSQDGKTLVSGAGDWNFKIWNLFLMTLVEPFLQQLTLAQSRLLDQVMQANQAKKILDLTKPENVVLQNIFNGLPQEIRDFLSEQRLVILQ